MTEIGVVGHGPVHVVAASGTIAAIGEAPRVDWWVGADDRWHVASAEPAVRQRLADDGSTIETRLRVPGGDVIQRAAAVAGGLGACVLVEIENASPLPVALAVVVRADGQLGVDRDTVTVDGRPTVIAGRSVAQVAVAGSEAELRQSLERGGGIPPVELVGGGHALMAALFPLPHTTVLRSTVSLGSGGASHPDDLPPLDAVARGWALHADRGARASVPDDRVTRAALAARRHLLSGVGVEPDDPFWTRDIEPWVPPVAAVALSSWGHLAAARDLLLAATGPDDLATHAVREPAEAGALLWAWAECLERAPDPDLQQALAPWVEHAAVGLLRRSRRRLRQQAVPSGPWRAVGLASAASLLTRAGDARLGADIVDALPALVADGDVAEPQIAFALGGRRLGRRATPSPRAALGQLLGLGDVDLGAIAATAAPTGALGLADRSQHPAASALFLLGLARALVDEPDGAGGPVSLLSEPDAGWLGAPMEGHGFPVTAGSVSFGVRWHDDRPAMLWDLDTTETQAAVVAPALDVHWRDERPRGEALLAPTPGLERAETPRSPGVRRGEVVDPGETPDSFD